MCFFVQRVARYGEVIPHGSVHLDARQISPRCKMKCGDFWVCFFVQQVARYDSFILETFDGARFTACADNRLI